jgi:uncharacterized protein YjiS (DUF1127 family)
MLHCNITGVSDMPTFEGFVRVTPKSPIAVDFLGLATMSRTVRAAMANMVARREELREFRQQARELATFTDRELGELGFSRGDLPSIAAGTYRR